MIASASLAPVRAQPGHVEGVANATRTRAPRRSSGRTARRALSSSSRTKTAHPSPSTKPFAAQVERAGRVCRIVVAGSRGLDRVEAGDGDRGDRRVGGAGDHHVGASPRGSGRRRSRRRRARRCSRWISPSTDPRPRPPRRPRRRMNWGPCSRRGAAPRRCGRPGPAPPSLLTTRYSCSRLVVAPTALPTVTPIRRRVEVGQRPDRCRPPPPGRRRRRTGPPGPSAGSPAGRARAATGSKSTSAAIWDRNCEGSKELILRVAVLPWLSRSQNSFLPLPPGARTPIPVITTRRATVYLRSWWVSPFNQGVAVQS